MRAVLTRSHCHSVVVDRTPLMRTRARACVRAANDYVYISDRARNELDAIACGRSTCIAERRDTWAPPKKEWKIRCAVSSLSPLFVPHPLRLFLSLLLFLPSSFLYRSTCSRRLCALSSRHVAGVDKSKRCLLCSCCLLSFAHFLEFAVDPPSRVVSSFNYLQVLTAIADYSSPVSRLDRGRFWGKTSSSFSN